MQTFRSYAQYEDETIGFENKSYKTNKQTNNNNNNKKQHILTNMVTQHINSL